MRDSTRLLLPFCLGLAMTARAELNYFLYDLSAGTAERLDVPPEDVLDETYHTGNLMLFVQDTAVSEAYAVGVFEVTEAQARAMGWATTSSSGSGPAVAYAAYTTNSNYSFSEGRFLPANLAWPTAEQWVAYAGEKWMPCNVSGGVESVPSGPFARSSWWETRTTFGKAWTPNDHGVYNIYGNVAEYATNNLFYGGYASTTCRYANLGQTGAAAENVGIGRDNWGLLGARLVYNLPEEQRHAVTVTLDGEAVGEAAAYKPGEAVTVEPPTPGAWRALTGRDVTPESLAVSGGVGEPIAFTMPGEAVTVAYTSTEYAEIAVVNGTLTLAEGKDRAYVGDWVTVTADAPKAWQIFKGWEVTGMTTPPATTEIIIFSVPEDAQDAITLTATYQDLPRVLIHGGTAAVSDGEARGNGFYTAGATLTLTPNTPEGWRFQGWEQEGEGTLEDNVFTVPESGVTTLTARFAEPPRVFVSGGAATVSEGTGYGNNAYAPGTVLRLTAADRVGYTFAGWKGGTVSDNTFTVPESGVTTLTATYTARTRVLVAGGTAEPASTDGYYDVGTKLALTADKPVGYVFDHWEGGTVSGSTFTVPASGTVILTAVFKVDEEAAGDGATLHLGSKTDSEPYDTLFGSTPAQSATSVTDPYGNKYLSYAYTDAADVAVFDLEEGEVSFAVDADTSTDGKTKRLQLRRVNASDGNDFYMGVFETTRGNVHYLETLTKADPVRIKDTTAAVYYSGSLYENDPDFEDCLEMLNNAFDVPEARFPTPAEVIKVGDASRAKNANAGYGAGLDETITEAMVHYNAGYPNFNDAGETTVDPYGFYDLWGNCWEMAPNNQAFGGTAAEEGPLAWRSCITKNILDPANLNTAVAFRPVIDVETPVALTVEGAGTIWAVEGEKLFPSPDETPVRPGYEFVGWTLGGAKIAPETYVVKRTDAGKTLAPQWEAISLTAKFVDCEGPAKVVPGLETRVLTDPNRTLSGFKIVPSGAAAYSQGTGFAIITFADDAKGEVTVTALYNAVSLTATFVDCEGPAAVAPGQTVAVSPTAGGTLVGLNVAPGEAADWALDGDGASLTFAGNAKGKVTVTGLYAGKTLDVAYEGCSGPTLACPGLTATLYLEPGRELERVEVVPAGAATYSREAGTLTFAQGASGAVTVTAVYAQPAKPGFRLLLR